MPTAMTLPQGTVTFLRTDIEGSMDLARALGAGYDELNAAHHGLVRAAIEGHGGQVVRTEGDAVFAVFADAGAAARAAVDIQRAMTAHDWPGGHALRLRIGIHTGTATRAGDDYGGFEVSRAARIAAAGWGGQVIVSDTARALIEDVLDAEWQVRDLGRHRLKGLPEPERLFQLEAPGLATEFGPLASGYGPADHLPERMTTLIGRERELGSLSELLATTRLLTLTGPGGTGKTTLAVELARRHADAYADGAWFVDLQAVRDVPGVRAQVARDLGLFDGPAGPAVERLLPFVAERELLIVVDNLEQVIDAADVVAELIAASRSSRVLATSRMPLRLSAEQVFVVRPLGLQADDGVGTSEAVRLFIERARRTRPDLRFGDDEVSAIEQTCRLVDGLPLAIELCAARVAILSVDRILDRLANRLPMPGSGPRDMPERQRTIEATVAWSYELLEPPLQLLFARLGVFGESFELEQAEAVCGPADELGIDVLEGLARLVEQSLLMRVDDAVGGVRFGLLETIRADASSRLDGSGEAPALTARHVRAYLELAKRYFPGHFEPTDETWLERLEADADNVRRAVRWAVDDADVEVALDLVGYLWPYWVHSGRLSEGRALTSAALGLPGSDARTEARVWAVAAAGSLAYWSNDMEQATACYEEQLALAGELDLAAGQASAWHSLIFTRRTAGDWEGAEAAAEEARRILADLGETERLDDLMASLAATSAPAVLADPERLLPSLEERIAKLEASTSPITQTTLPVIRSLAFLAKGELISSGQQFVRAMRIGLAWHRVGDVIVSLTFMASIGTRYLDAEIPATLLGAAEVASERYGVIGPQWAEILSPGGPDPRTMLMERLGQEAFDAAIEDGRRMTLEQAADYMELKLAELAGT